MSLLSINLNTLAMARLVLFSARISQLINHSAMIPLSSRASPRSNWKRYKSTPLNVSNLSVAYIFPYKANASLAPQRTIKKIIRSECQSIHPRAKRRDAARGEEFEEDPVSIVVVRILILFAWIIIVYILQYVMIRECRNCCSPRRWR